MLWIKELTTLGKYGEFGSLAKHMRFVDRACRRLARNSFMGMGLYQAKMQYKQNFLFRCVDIVMELFAIAASVSRARQMELDGHPEAAKAVLLADTFARSSRRKVRRLFRELWSNEDKARNLLAKSVLKGEQTWLLEGRLDPNLEQSDFTEVFLTAGRTEEATGETTEEKTEPQLKAVS